MTRPMNEVALAILKTANQYSAAGRRVTLAEMAAGANVGQQAARQTVSNLKRLGHLQIVSVRRVDYRNRPVAEYAPTPPAAPEPVDNAPDVCWLDLSNCLAGWAR
jgi:hypothetical protein